MTVPVNSCSPTAEQTPTVVRFNAEILAKKRSQYLDKFYNSERNTTNSPSDMESAGISKDCFQCHDQGNLAKYDNKWFVGANRM